MSTETKPASAPVAPPKPPKAKFAIGDIVTFAQPGLVSVAKIVALRHQSLPNGKGDNQWKYFLDLPGCTQSIPESNLEK